jgi:hypothetical protein
MASLRAEMALQAEDLAAAAVWAERAIVMAREVRRVKYEAVSRGLLGKVLLATGRREDALRELHAAVKGAEAVGNPSGRWRARADLARALEVAGNDAGAQDQLRAAADIILDVAAGLAADRAARFLAAPAVADVLKTV